MAQDLLQMMSIARDQDLVVERALEDDMRMFVYPLPLHGFLVGVGYDTDQAHRVSVNALLQRRTDQIERFGDWLPALFSDGSCYLLRRVETDVDHADEADGDDDADEAPLSTEELFAAKELLS